MAAQEVEARLTCLRTAGANEKMGTRGGGTSWSLRGVEPPPSSRPDPPAIRQTRISNGLHPRSKMDSDTRNRRYSSH